MAGRSVKPLFGASGLDIGAGEKLIRLGVVRVVFRVDALIGDGADDVTVKPEVLITGTDAAVVVEGKL